MQKSFRWRWGVFAGTVLALVSLLPQAHLCFIRGREWQGAYAFFYSDEPAYAAYLNALIGGRPRRNDPYTGSEDRRGASLPETLFSIQSLPAYLLAWPARLLGLKTTTVFILLMPLTAFAASLAVYRLLAMLTRDEHASFAGTLAVLSFGILVSGQGFIVELFGGASGYVFLPFLRRYVPGVPLVFFFAFCGSLWRALTCETRGVRLLAAFGAGLLFAAQVYSYFYHWTHAAALTLCAALAWLLARPPRWRDALLPLAIIAVVSLASLAPYSALLSRRAPSMEATQALLRTRAPDLWRGVIFVAALALLALAWSVRSRRRGLRDPRVLFAAALAASVFIVFNQQLVTGLSLQPMHYEQYVGNYVALAAAVVALTLLWQGRGTGERARQAQASQLVPRRLWLPVAAVALLWAAGESVSPTLRLAQLNLTFDDWTTAAAQLARQAQPLNETPVVFNPSDYRMDLLPSLAPCAVLWAPHTFAFDTLTPEENRLRVFQFLYFSGVAPEEFTAQGRDQGFLQFSLFGWERANPRLTLAHRPVTLEEIAAEQRNYAAYVSALESARTPPAPTLSFVVVSDDQPFRLRNLTRFYTFDAPVRAGQHTIYHVRPLRP